MAAILIVDDEENILETLRLHFRMEKIDVDTACSAEAALKMHEEHLYKIILTDIRMPGMSGVQVVKRAKSINPLCQIFVMTGYGSISNLTECIESGATDYMIKPFDNMDEVINLVKDALQRQEKWKRDLASFLAEKRSKV